MRRRYQFSFLVILVGLLTCASRGSAEVIPKEKKEAKVPEAQKTRSVGASHLAIQDNQPLKDEDYEFLWRALTRGDWQSREAATSRLMIAGDSARPLLRRGQSHPDPEVRMRVALVSRRTDVIYARALKKLTAAKMARRAYEILRELRKNKTLLHDSALRSALNFSGAGAKIIAPQTAAMQLMIEFAKAEDTEAIASLLRRDFQVAIDSSSDPLIINSPFYSVLSCLFQLPRARVLKALQKIAETQGAAQNAFPRIQALMALAYMGERETALPILKKLILTRGTTVQIAALQALEQLAESPEDIDFLKPVIKSEDEDVSRRCVRIFGMFRDKSAVPAMMKVLERNSEALQIEAIRSLGLIAEVQAENMLRLFASPKLPVSRAEQKSRLLDLAKSRGLAFWALARLGKVREVELLKLIEAGTGVEYMALLSLAELNTDKALKMLKTQVLRTDKKAEELHLSLNAVRVMGSMSGNQKVSNFLRDLALEGASQSLRQAAVAALRDQGDAFAKKQLAKLAAESFSARRDVVSEVLLAVGKLDIQSAKPALLRQFYALTKARSARDLLRQESFPILVEALGNLGGKDCIQAFKSLEPKFVRPAPKPKRAKPEFLQAPRKDGKIYQPRLFGRYLSLAYACAHCGDNSLIEPAITIFFNDRDAELHKYQRSNYTSADLNRLGILLLYAREWDRARFAFQRQQWVDDRGRSLNVQVYNHACTNALMGRVKAAISDLYLAFYNNHEYWVHDDRWRHFSTDLDLRSLKGHVHYEKMKRQLRLEYFLRPSLTR